MEEITKELIKIITNAKDLAAENRYVILEFAGCYELKLAGVTVMVFFRYKIKFIQNYKTISLA